MRKKYTITKKKFLDWLFSDIEDWEYWGFRWIKEMKEYGEVAITVEELFEQRDSLPGHLFCLDDIDEIPINKVELISDNDG